MIAELQRMYSKIVSHLWLLKCLNYLWQMVKSLHHPNLWRLVFIKHYFIFSNTIIPTMFSTSQTCSRQFSVYINMYSTLQNMYKCIQYTSKHTTIYILKFTIYILKFTIYIYTCFKVYYIHLYTCINICGSPGYSVVYFDRIAAFEVL